MAEVTRLMLVRDKFTKDTTLGQLFLNGAYFCETLEDTVRPSGIKVKGHTAIPPTTKGYNVGIRLSPSSNKERLIVYTEPDQETLIEASISFKYIYFHGGNTHEDTDGCILVASRRIPSGIQGNVTDQLFDILAPKIKRGEKVTLHITNLKQNG